MSLPSTPEPRRGATAAQLKDDIDSGRTGDKAPGFDPGAAPLGVDEEAGGAPHDPELLAATRAQEKAGRPVSRAPNAATPELQPDARAPGRGYALPAALGLAAAGALAAVLLAAL